jgi:hypothetical protein
MKFELSTNAGSTISEIKELLIEHFEDMGFIPGVIETEFLIKDLIEDEVF